MEEVIVRPAEPKDLRQVMHLYQSAGWKKVCKYIDFLDENRNGQYLLVAENKDKKVVGTAQLNIIETIGYGRKPYGVVEFVVVDEKYRRCGIGRQIFEEIDLICKKKDCFCVMLSSNICHLEAHQFYTSLGYTAPYLGFRKNYQGENDNIAHWEKIKGSIRCSRCYFPDSVGVSNFCKNCGARMV